MIEGQSLRELRLSKGLTLRQVARIGKLSHTHLSKVERSERAIAPVVVLAYEQACGVKLTGDIAEPGPPALRPGQLNEGLRRRFAGRVGAVAAGGVPDGMSDGDWADLNQLRRFLRIRRVPESLLDEAGLSSLAQIVDLLTRLDGELPGQVAGLLLPWVVDLLVDVNNDKLDAGLHVAMSQLALRAGQAAMVLEGHETARSLYLVALYAARRADELDLAARVLAAIAEQHIELEHYRDAVNTCRLGEVDDRITEATRQRLAAIRTGAVDAERRLDERVRAATEEQPRG